MKPKPFNEKKAKKIALKELNINLILAGSGQCTSIKSAVLECRLDNKREKNGFS